MQNVKMQALTRLRTACCWCWRIKLLSCAEYVCVALQVRVQVTCMQPFLEAPRLQLQYTTGSRQVLQDLTLPLAPHKFMVPEPHIAKEAFFEKWKSYPGDIKAPSTQSATSACLASSLCTTG